MRILRQHSEISRGGGSTYTPAEMAGAILNLPSGGGGISVDDIAMQNITGDIVFTTATIVKNKPFSSMPITSAGGTSVTEIKGEAFRYCSSLASISFPNVTKFSGGNNEFGGCTALTQAMFPKLSEWSSCFYAFADCTNLAVCDLGSIASMNNNTFNGCTSLRTLILRKTGSICTANWWNAAVFGGLYNNPTQSTIYVPQALISTYQTATNWSSAYASGVTFKKIEGSIYELS